MGTETDRYRNRDRDRDRCISYCTVSKALWSIIANIKDESDTQPNTPPHISGLKAEHTPQSRENNTMRLCDHFHLALIGITLRKHRESVSTTHTSTFEACIHTHTHAQLRLVYTHTHTHTHTHTLTKHTS